MSMAWLSDFVKALDVKARFFYAAAAFGWIVLKTKSLPEFRSVIIIASLACLVLAAVKSYEPIASVIRERKRRARVIADLANISPPMLRQLLALVHGNMRSMNTAPGYATEQLAALGLFEVTPSNRRELVTYVVPLFVWKHLTSNEAQLKARYNELEARGPFV